MNKKFIQLPKGGTLELDLTPAFLERVRAHVGVNSVDDVNDDHLRMYIFGTVKSALDKSETFN
jgi:hypothetical protein